MYEKIEYPFQSFNGVDWTQDGVDSYNQCVERCNRYISEGRSVESQEWQHLLNTKHKAFCISSSLFN